MLICTTDNDGDSVSRALAAGCNAALADSLAVKPENFTVFGHLRPPVEFIYTVKVH
jgi:hypothetical protein